MATSPDNDGIVIALWVIVILAGIATGIYLLINP